MSNIGPYMMSYQLVGHAVHTSRHPVSRRCPFKGHIRGIRWCVVRRCYPPKVHSTFGCLVGVEMDPFWDLPLESTRWWTHFGPLLEVLNRVLASREHLVTPGVHMSSYPSVMPLWGYRGCRGCAPVITRRHGVDPTPQKGV